MRHGIDVTVYATNAGLDHNVPVNMETIFDGVKITYFSYTKFFEFLDTPGRHFSLPITLVLKRRHKKFDIIYIIGVWNYPIAGAAHFCSKYHKPYIISAIGVLYPDVVRKKSWKKLP